VSAALGTYGQRLESLRKRDRKGVGDETTRKQVERKRRATTGGRVVGKVREGGRYQKDCG